MTQDRPLLGIALMLGFCMVIPLGDAIAKLLTNRVPVAQIVFIRFAAQAALLLPLALAMRLPLSLSRRVAPLLLLRTLLQMGGIAAMFTAFRYLPLADAVAIAFVMPFLMLLLGKYVLKEQVGLRRLGACVVGFTGTLLVIQPSFAAVGWNALWPLLVAVIFALFMLVTRKIAKETDPISLQAVAGAMGTVLLAPVFLIGDAAGLHALSITAPPQDTWALLAAAGALGTVAHLMMTWSLRFAPTSTLASMQYLEIPVAVFFGWLFFYELPNTLSAFGILLTISAGLYAVLRERKAAEIAERINPA
ncbi:DMT family transporter [Leisingera sp. NJS204]|uniref:DMT family transporter n=1 Tax=Leisingera sp. NJS204 TaxID=2508307 RepID=UPI0010122963|nr:DMT family transporter [Leisingera sp. NJS204]QAX29073.1 DMT family transporter [Leisingera sp. NJS204]